MHTVKYSFIISMESIIAVQRKRPQIKTEIDRHFGRFISSSIYAADLIFGDRIEIHLISTTMSLGHLWCKRRR